MKVALACIAKNEDNYIDEWMLYYDKLGIDDIFIYMNDWELKTWPKEIDSKLHLIRANGEYMLLPAYNHFIQTFYKDFDFGMIFDVDEFLVLRKHKNIHDFLQQYADKNIQAIGVNQWNFGDSGLSKVENGNYSCIDRFRHSDVKLNTLIKPIINFKETGNKVKVLNPHILNIPLHDPDLTKTTTNGNFYHNFTNESAVLCHYRNKTYEEAKFRRFGTNDALFGYNNHMKDNKVPTCECRYDIDEFNKSFEEHNHNEMQNDLVYNFYHDIEN